MSGSLAKLPFIFLVATSLHVTFKRPTPPVPKDEQASSGVREMIIVQLLKIKNVFWAAAFVEAVLILGHIIWPRENGENPFYLTPTSVIGALIAMTGSYIRQQCYEAMGPMFTFEVTIQKEHKLITHGPYSFVRHPGYTGVLGALVGATFWYFNPGSLLGELTAWVNKAAIISLFALSVSGITMIAVTRIEEEEKLLKQRFGAEWDTWAQKVSYKLVPRVY